MTWERKQHLRQIGEATKKALQHRQWKWSRRMNGFSDQPLWRVVARKVSLPLATVVAFVNRLEELANKADDRGSVADFSAAEFGAALDIAEEDAARIFAALEQQDVAWVAYDHIADFHGRNRDGDGQDSTAAERNRRLRARKSGMAAIAKMVGRGELPAEARALIEAQVLNDVDLSTALQRYDVTRRLAVTVTAEQSRHFQSAPVDNNGAGARGEKAANEGAGGSSEVSSPRVAPAAGSSTDADRYGVTVPAVDNSEAASWLQGEGARIVVERMAVTPQRAALLLERWARDLDDPMAMAAIILGADNAELSGPRFHVSVSSQIERHVRAKANGAPLPLGPVRLGPAAAGPLRAADEPVASPQPSTDPVIALPRKAAG
jgi:hypothetical protein